MIKYAFNFFNIPLILIFSPWGEGIRERIFPFFHFTSAKRFAIFATKHCKSYKNLVGITNILNFTSHPFPFSSPPCKYLLNLVFLIRIFIQFYTILKAELKFKFFYQLNFNIFTINCQILILFSLYPPSF